MNEPMPPYDCSLFRIERCPACEDTDGPYVYTVTAKDNGATIGAVKWNPVLSEFCFYPRPKTAWNWDALFHVLNYLINGATDRALEGVKDPRA